MFLRRCTLFVAAVCSLSGCAAEGVPAGPTLSLGVTALTLPGLDDACYTIAVNAGDAARLAAGAAPLVWQETGICADRFGDGRGGIAYVGTCDATVATNTVSLVLERLCSGGACDPTLVSDPNALAASTFTNPCPPDAPCVLEAACRENVDTPVEFNLTVMRDAGQGFFDIAIGFEDVFCSAKFDCVDADTERPLALLFDGDTRGPTAVLALACTAGVDQDTVLALSDIVLGCSDGTRIVIDPAAGDGGNVFAASHDADLYQVAVYEGAEALRCDGAPCRKRFWNVAMGLRWDALIARGVDCAFSARATVSAGPLVDGRTPAGWRYPVIDFAVPAIGLGPDQERALICGRHALDGGDEVTTGYVGPAPEGPFCGSSDALASTRAASCAPVPCGAGYWGPTCDDACAMGACASGPTCDDEGDLVGCTSCPSGTWGPTCGASCAQGACLGVVTCDQETGEAILCGACGQGTWGATCTAACVSTQCAGDLVCTQDDGVTVSCSDCADGFWGPDCSGACAPGVCPGVSNCNEATGEVTCVEVGNSEWASWWMPDSKTRVCMTLAGTPGACPASGTLGYGQDGNYLINPPGFTTVGVTEGEARLDNVTGLTWQKDIAGTYTWAEAQAYCDAIYAAGIDDWRLPSIIELVSLLDVGRAWPAIDFAAFPGPVGSPNAYGGFWSATPGAIGVATAWYVAFTDGIIARTGTGPTAKAKVRCVSGGAPAVAAPAPPGRYTCGGVSPCLATTTGDTVTDTGTGLMWQRNLVVNLQLWRNALTMCEGLTLDGYTDWRLPNVKELHTIVDRSRSDPAIDVQAFGGQTTGTAYWTGSPYIYEPSTVWYVNFLDGSANRGQLSNAARVRCVR